MSIALCLDRKLAAPRGLGPNPGRSWAKEVACSTQQRLGDLAVQGGRDAKREKLPISVLSVELRRSMAHYCGRVATARVPIGIGNIGSPVQPSQGTLSRCKLPCRSALQIDNVHKGPARCDSKGGIGGDARTTGRDNFSVEKLRVHLRASVGTALPSHHVPMSTA